MGQSDNPEKNGASSYGTGSQLSMEEIIMSCFYSEHYYAFSMQSAVSQPRLELDSTE